MAERLLVIGGDAAGMSAASQARRRRGPEDLNIVAFEKGRHVSYSACGIPYYVGGVIEDADELIARTPEDFRKRGIEVRLGHEVVEIDLAARRVRVLELDGGRELIEGFDQLVIGTGAVPYCPPWPGADAEGIFGVQTLGDGLRLRRALDQFQPRRAVVIGGGYIGLELGEALRMRGLEVSLVERAPQPMSTLDPDMGEMVADAMREKGFALYLEETVEGLETGDGRVRAVVTDRRALPAELVILGLGVRPNSGLARAAGLAVGPESGGIVTDLRMRTAAEGVWAAGDCVQVFHQVSRRPVSIALGTHANKQGRVVGINIGGGYATFPGVIGTAVTRICDTEIARTGLNEREARAAGFDYFTSHVRSTTRAGYYPGGTYLTIKVLAERGSGRLLGAQIVGREGAAKRIDVLATAIWNRMSVDALQMVDMSYAPPFSPVWDPVLIAARKAAEKLGEERAS